MGSFSPGHGAFLGCGWRRPPENEVAANILNKQLRIANEGWSTSFGVGREANKSPPQKNQYVMKC
jgi:hypothetical protein